jgi:mannose-6-phosphate isomerase-like protein (cupin superfamily)
MTKQKNKSIESAIIDAAYGQKNHGVALNNIIKHGFKVLPILAEHLTKNLPLEEIEKFEDILKVVLYNLFKSPVISGETARKLALFQKEIGFIFKYKAYAIKASTPLGYSIFIQNKGEGFSFQQHITHKVEVFHIIDVHPGGYVFLCEYEDWILCYDEKSFLAWLAGQPDERYDQFKYNPKPGDIFILDRLKVLHSVIGCTLEEYATVSTDMVDRLHDQNLGRPIPPQFNHEFANKQIGSLSFPNKSRNVDILSYKQRISDISSDKIPGGEKKILAHMPGITASNYCIEPSGITEFQYDDQCAVSVYINEGEGYIVIGERNEVRSLTPPTIPICSGDVLIVPPKIYYGFVNKGNCPLKFSEHKIPFNLALGGNANSFA